MIRTMEPLINYRLLSDRLTQTEFISFLQQSITTLNARKLFTKLLYDKFKQSPNITKSFTNIISNIIRNREQPDPSISSLPTTISELPSSLISECGSYLQMEEYFKFSQSCCKINLSLHQHPKLIQCAITPTSKIAKCPRSHSLKIFRNSEKLIIDTKYFYDNLSFQNQSIWKQNENLKHIELRVGSKMSNLLNRELIKQNNVETVSFYNMQYMESAKYAQNVNAFLQYLLFFPNLKFLKLSRITFNSVANATNPFTEKHRELIKTKGANITALEIGHGNNETYFCQAIVDSIGNQLEALNIVQPSIDLSKIKWNKLDELILYTPTIALLNQILPSAVNLKTAMIICRDSAAYKLWEENMLKSQKSLELMYVSCGSTVKNVLEGIENSLIRCKYISRKSQRFTIKVSASIIGAIPTQFDNLFASLFRVFDAMKQVNCWKDIRLILVLHGNQKLDINMKEIKELLEELDAIKDDYLIEHGFVEAERVTHAHSYRVVISNKNCKINGYSLYDSFKSSSFI